MAFESGSSAMNLDGRGSRNYKIQLLVPIYNEGRNVRILFDSLLKESVDFDVLTFVYDIDEDTSLPYIAEISSVDSRVRALKNTFGRGVVNALRFGFSQSVAGPVVVLMGDNSDKLSIVTRMVELWCEGAILVSPSRYMRGGEQHGGGLLKSWLSRRAGQSLWFFGFPTSDPTNNFKLYDGQWLKAQPVESIGGFEVALELSYKAFVQGKRIEQLPTVWFDRQDGQSKFRLFKWLPHYLRWYLRCLGELVVFKRRKLTCR